MKKFTIKINPLKNEILYEINGDLDDILSVDDADLKKINKHFQKLRDNKFSIKPSQISGTSEHADEQKSDELKLNVPDNLIEKIESMKNEETKFPILWFYCNPQQMTVSEFLELITASGFTLSPSWLPSAGGNFSNRLVKRDKFFHYVDKKKSVKVWDFTQVGKLKVRKLIQSLS